MNKNIETVTISKSEYEHLTGLKIARSAELIEDIENIETYTVEHELNEEECKCPKCAEDVYFTYACRKCHEKKTDTPVVETPHPNPVIKRSFAAARAIAHLITQKFVIHSPLYCQEQKLKQKGIELSRQMTSNWFITE